MRALALSEKSPALIRDGGFSDILWTFCSRYPISVHSYRILDVLPIYSTAGCFFLFGHTAALVSEH